MWPSKINDGSPVTSRDLEDTIWALERWGVQGGAVAGVVSATATDDDKAKALVIANYVVSALAKLASLHNHRLYHQGCRKSPRPTARVLK